MKYILTLATICLLAVACMPPEMPEAKIKEQIDSLKTVQTEAGEKIAELEEQLLAMDTTRKLVEVTTLDLKKSTFKHYFNVQANLEADKSAMIFPESQGLIKEIYVKEGQKVTKGQKLMRLDAAIVGTQIADLKNQLALATDVYERQKRLWDQNIGSEMQLLQAKNNKESLENSIKTLQTQAGMSTVRAPFAGTVDDVMPKIGEMASPAMPVARIVNVGDVYLKAEISERYLGKVDVGDSVEVEFPGVLETAAVVKRTGSYINPNSRSFEVIMDIPNKDAVLKPNMLAKLKINDYTAKETVVLPSSMIQQDTRGNSFVYTLEKMGSKQKVRKVEIQTGLDYEGNTEVLAGLEDLEKIVDKGARQIANGEEVEVL